MMETLAISCKTLNKFLALLQYTVFLNMTLFALPVQKHLFRDVFENSITKIFRKICSKAPVAESVLVGLQVY